MTNTNGELLAGTARGNAGMELTSAAFTNEDVIPTRFTGSGGNFSPPLAWSQPPQGTKTLALVCIDPDAPRGPFTHWVIFNVPGDSRELKEGVPPKPVLRDGAVQGNNDLDEIGYTGPNPPPGKTHRYMFKLFALDTTFGLPPGTSHAELRARTRGHILAEADLVGTCGR
jgi:Raf kinase inhibitor-like YbhB/YbcL family protein